MTLLLTGGWLSYKTPPLRSSPYNKGTVEVQDNLHLSNLITKASTIFPNSLKKNKQTHEPNDLPFLKGKYPEGGKG